LPLRLRTGPTMKRIGASAPTQLLRRHAETGQALLRVRRFP
jgi:hypothetical protein